MKCNSAQPASKSKRVSLALHLATIVVLPLEVGQARSVIELDLVEDGPAVASLCYVRDVGEKLGEAGVRPHGAAS